MQHRRAAAPTHINWTASLALLLTFGCCTPAGASPGFIKNLGQWDPAVLYVRPAAETSIFFTAGGLIVGRQDSVAASLQFVDADPRPSTTAGGQQATLYNFYLGNPSRWRAAVPAYTEIVYSNLWPGVDLIFQDHPNGLRYTISATGDAGLSRVQWVAAGGIAIAPPFPGKTTGTLSWDGEGAGASASVCGSSNAVLSRDLDNPEALVWSTLLGGSSDDYGHALALNNLGQPILAGSTHSIDYPTTPGASADTLAGLWDLVVSKLDAAGETLLWSTYIGGDSYDINYDIALDASGNPVITGKTESENFPTTSGAYDESHNGSGDVFVLKLGGGDGALQWSTLAGDIDNDLAFSMLLDDAGNPIVAGYTLSPGFPTTLGAYDESHNGEWDAFLFKLTASGDALLWGTFFGGRGDDRVYDTAADELGCIYLTSWTTSEDLPVSAGAYDISYNGGEDAYVAKFNSAGDQLEWCTYLGGSDIDRAYAIDVDSGGNPVVAGWVRSNDFPHSPGAYDEMYNGDDDIFITKLSSAGAALLWSTFLGGAGGEIGRDLAIDPYDNVIITGGTTSSDFPTTPGAVDTTQNGSYDIYLTKLAPDGRDLFWSGLVGGSGWEEGYALALDGDGHPVLSGDTSSPDFPTTPGVYAEEPRGLIDILILKLDLGNASSVSPGPPARPAAQAGFGLFPNPASSNVTFVFDLPEPSRVVFHIYNVAGRLIRRIDGGETFPAGQQRLCWDGRDNAGKPLATGCYLVRRFGTGRSGDSRFGGGRPEDGRAGQAVAASTQRLIFIAD